MEKRKAISEILIKPWLYLACYVLLIFLFAVLLTYGKFDVGLELPQTIEFWDAVYLSCVTITTLGYGDFTPHDPFSKAVCAVESVSGILIIGLFLNAVAQTISRRASEVEEQKYQKIQHQLFYRIHKISEEIRRLIWGVTGVKYYLTYGNVNTILIRDCRDESQIHDPVKLISIGMFLPSHEDLDEFEAKLVNLSCELGNAIDPFLNILEPEFSEPILNFHTRFGNMSDEDRSDDDERTTRAFGLVIMARLQFKPVQSALFLAATKVQTREEYWGPLRTVLKSLSAEPIE